MIGGTVDFVRRTSARARRSIRVGGRLRARLLAILATSTILAGLAQTPTASYADKQSEQITSLADCIGRTESPEECLKSPRGLGQTESNAAPATSVPSELATPPGTAEGVAGPDQGPNSAGPSTPPGNESFAASAPDAARAAISSGEVLILASTVSGGDTSVEANAVRAAGLTPIVVDDATWSSTTATQFSSYRAVVLGDPTCTSTRPVAEQNTSVWGPALDGNVIVVGTDPVYHSSQGGQKLTELGIAFASSEPTKTGAYITLSCYYHDTAPATPVKLLDALEPGGFTVTGVGCYNDAHIVAAHASTSGLSDSDLSGWSCSVHEAFDKWPASFQVLAIAKDFGAAFTASDGTVGTPYILASGSGLKTFPLSASPADAVVPVGSNHTITAELLDGITRAPEPGALIRAYFRPPGGGLAVSVQIGCDTPLCLTDSAGTIRFTYRSPVPRIDEVTVWHDQNANNGPDIGEPQVRVRVTWERTIRMVAMGDSYSSGEGNPPFDAGTDGFFNRCHRSPQAWPRLLGVPADLHIACSGALTSHMFTAKSIFGPDNQGQLAQLKALHKSQSVDVVTVTIGGNDLGFEETLTACFTSVTSVGSCLPLPALNRLQINVLARRLANKIYPAIRTAAPGAKLVVVGYPQLFPDSIGEVSRCGWLTNYELTEMNKLQAYLDTKMQAAATKAGATFVSVLDALDGHELCSSSPWIYDLGLAGGQLRGHPVELEDKHGQSAIANVVRPFLGL